MENVLVIMGYGFSLPENSSDHYSLGFSQAIVAYVKDSKARRSARKPKLDRVQSQVSNESSNTPSKPSGGTVRGGGQILETSGFNVEEILEQNIHWVRLIEDGNFEFSPFFLENFSIAVENSREAHNADNCSTSETRFSGRDFSRNQLHVTCAIVMILQKGQRAIRKHDKDIVQAPQNNKQIDAARYRDGQLKILECVLDSVCTFLKAFTTANPPETSNNRVLRLEHTLTNLPKDFLKDLRGVLNAGLRTRDPIKIRERGGVDFAFTAWLCGLWVFSQSDRKGEDDVDPTYLRWLQFLQQNYAEPSEESINQQSHENLIQGERAEWFDPVRSANGDTEMDPTFVAQSYFDAVQAAAEKRPQSMYNDERITLRRLEWCLNIIKNEGVWCPNLDQGEGEENDDWVLFLELGDS